MSPPDFVDYRRDNACSPTSAAYIDSSYPLTGTVPPNSSPARRSPVVLCGDGHAAAAGRVITDEDDREGARDVVVLSHALWARRFGSSPGIIGQQLQINGMSREVIGVMPEGFQFPLQSEFWIPLKFTARDLETQRGAHYISVIARLKPARRSKRPARTCARVAARLAQEYPRTNRETSASVHPLREALVGSVRRSMFVLLGAVGLVLLIVCVNIASWC